MVDAATREPEASSNPAEAQINVADALTLALRTWDVGYVFGVSGANIEHVHDAIHRMGEGRLTSVMARSEVGAAFMADAHARVHRTLGVCCATSGGGMMNLAVGIAEAYAESVPVLAIVGQVSTALEGRGGFQDSSGRGRTVDAMGLWRSVAKKVLRIHTPADIWPALREAAEAALSGRPGPAVLLIPRDVQAAEAQPMPEWFPRRIEALRRPRGLRDTEAINALLERLRRAERPVMLLGSGVLRSADPDAVLDFVRACHVPVMTTMANPGLFDHGDPLFLGTVGVAGHPSAHRYLNARADLVVAVGTGLDVMTRAPLSDASTHAALAVVNVDAGALLRSAAPELLIEADAGVAFRALRRAWDAEPFRCAAVDQYRLERFRPALSPSRPARVEAEHGAIHRATPSDSAHAAENPPELRQSEALAMLEPYLPENGHLIFDAGNCAASALHSLEMPRGTSTTIALGMGGMGYAIAAATGAQLGSRDGTRTVVLCGDGAFLMLGFEVHTAIGLQLPVLFVVFNNGRHGMCVTRQELFFDGRLECSAYPPVNVAAIASGLGRDALWTGRAATSSQLARCLEDFHAHHVDGPGVLELVLPAEEMPPFTPFLPKDAETYVREDRPIDRADARRTGGRRTSAA